MKRLQSQAGEIAAPLVGGWAVKETHILGKYSGIAGDILAGIGIGVGAKAVLDPPINRTPGRNVIRVSTPEQTIKPSTQSSQPRSGCPQCKWEV